MQDAIKIMMAILIFLWYLIASPFWNTEIVQLGWFAHRYRCVASLSIRRCIQRGCGFLSDRSYRSGAGSIAMNRSANAAMCSVKEEKCLIPGDPIVSRVTFICM